MDEAGIIRDRLGHARARLSAFTCVWTWRSRQTTDRVGGLFVWMLSIGRARQPGPVCWKGSLVCWVCKCWELAYLRWLGNKFPRSVPGCCWAQVNSHQAGCFLFSVWAPACHDHMSGGNGGVGVVVPSFDALLGGPWVMGVQSSECYPPHWEGWLIYLFVAHGYKGAQEDVEKLPHWQAVTGRACWGPCGVWGGSRCFLLIWILTQCYPSSAAGRALAHSLGSVNFKWFFYMLPEDTRILEITSV